MWRGHSPESFVAKYSGENAGEILQANTCEAVMRGGRAAGSERDGQRGPTFMRQKVRSLWQSDVQTILIRTSYALGGSTTISSTASGSPAALHTAAARSEKTGQRSRAAAREPPAAAGENRNRRGRARDRIRLLLLPLHRMGRGPCCWFSMERRLARRRRIGRASRARW